MWHSAPSLCKWNKIINFVPSVKLQKIDFLQDPKKAYIFYANRFLYFLQKKSRNKLCLRPHDTYFLFRMFLSRVNNIFFCHRSGVITFLEEVKKWPNYPSLTGPLQQQFIHCSQWEDIIIKQCIYNQRMRQKKTIKK